MARVKKVNRKPNSKKTVLPVKTRRPIRISAVARESSIICVKAGGSEKGIVLHTAFLSNFTDYFKGAFSDSSAEAEDGVVILDGIDEKAFNVFADFVYNQRIPEGLKDWAGYADVKLRTGDATQDEKNLDSALLLCYRTYILADRLSVPALKEVLLEAFFKEFQDNSSYPHGPGVAELCANLAGNDPLVKMLVDSQCLSWDKDDPRWMDSFQHLPHDFLARVTLRLYEFWETDKKKGRKPRVLKRSDYGLE